nr:MAG TPA: hypothetical protein [Caudoviricetes sp.]
MLVVLELIYHNILMFRTLLLHFYLIMQILSPYTNVVLLFHNLMLFIIFYNFIS